MKDMISIIPTTPDVEEEMFSGPAAEEIGADFSEEGEAFSFYLPNGIDAGLRFGADGTVVIVSKTPISAVRIYAVGHLDNESYQMAFRFDRPPDPEPAKVDEATTEGAPQPEPSTTAGAAGPGETVTVGPDDVGHLERAGLGAT